MKNVIAIVVDTNIIVSGTYFRKRVRKQLKYLRSKKDILLFCPNILRLELLIFAKRHYRNYKRKFTVKDWFFIEEKLRYDLKKFKIQYIGRLNYQSFLQEAEQRIKYNEDAPFIASAMFLDNKSEEFFLEAVYLWSGSRDNFKRYKNFRDTGNLRKILIKRYGELDVKGNFIISQVHGSETQDYNSTFNDKERRLVMKDEKNAFISKGKKSEKKIGIEAGVSLLEELGESFRGAANRLGLTQKEMFRKIEDIGDQFFAEECKELIEKSKEKKGDL